MAITRRGTQIFKLAADAKPTAANVQAGTELINTDDRKRWINSGTDWIVQELPIYKKYKVFKDGATTYVTDIHGKVVQSNSDTQVAVQAQIDSITSQNCFEFVWDADDFTMNNPLITPTVTQGETKMIRHIGSGFAGWRIIGGGCTRLTASASFPTQRYFFELNCTGATNTTTGQIAIDGFHVYNAQAPTTQIGFLKLEAGNIQNGMDTFNIKNIFAEYCWRVLHIISTVWWGNFENISSYESSAPFVGGEVIRLENGGHTGAVGPSPKFNLFRNIKVLHGAGLWDSVVRMRAGNYNRFYNIFANGYSYKRAVYDLDCDEAGQGLRNNSFRDCVTIDLIGIPTPDNRLGHIYCNGSVVDCSFFNYYGAPWTGGGTTLNLSGSGVERNYFELPAVWGTTTRVSDATAGQSNTVRILTGGIVVGGTEGPIIHTGGTSRIIDARRGAERAGFTSVADGGTITHALYTTPLWIQLTPSLANTIAAVTAKSATTFTVSLKTDAGTAGTTQSVYWRAGVYA